MSKTFNLLLFQDPASLFAYQLISLHNDVMWYIFLILSLVYWVLYKILSDFSWSVFNKQTGLLRSALFFNICISFNDIFMKILWKFYYYFLLFTSRWLNLCFYIFSKIWPKYKNIDWTIFMYEMTSPSSIPLLLRPSLKLYLDKYFAYLLFNLSTNANFYYKYNNGKNSLTALSWSHNTIMEYVFASFPTIIIGLILLPSFYLLYSIDEDLDPIFTIKVIGNQWYWEYEFNNLGTQDKRLIPFKASFQSSMILEEYLHKGGFRLLETDKALIVPLNVTLRFLVTSSDVLHAWALPELSIKIDAVPGRLNQIIAAIIHAGAFYGQCSELCGVGHSFMPIEVQAIPSELWIDSCYSKYKNGQSGQANILNLVSDVADVDTSKLTRQDRLYIYMVMEKLRECMLCQSAFECYKLILGVNEDEIEIWARFFSLDPTNPYFFHKGEFGDFMEFLSSRKNHNLTPDQINHLMAKMNIILEELKFEEELFKKGGIFDDDPFGKYGEEPFCPEYPYEEEAEYTE